MKRKLRSSSSAGSSKKNFNVPLSIVTFFLGVIATFAITQVFAQTSETNQIYACVNNTNGNVRIVTANDNCKTAEKSVKWSVQGPQGPQGTPGTTSNSGLPFTCNNCALFPYGEKFRGKDFSNAQIRNTEFISADLTGVIFKGAWLASNGFTSANLTGADFSELSRDVIQSAPAGMNFYSQNLNFRSANLTNATFEGSIVHSFDFRSADLKNTNFTNAIIRQSKFQGAMNASTANFTGATWESTTCPDGTNSDSNGNTCVGHLN